MYPISFNVYHQCIYMLRSMDLQLVIFVSDCPTLRAPTHGSFSSSSVAHGTYMNVSCDTNYSLVGKAILLCVSGSWSETVGTCAEGKKLIFKE